MGILTKLRRAFAAPPAPIGEGTVIPDQSLFSQVTRFYGGHTPESISNIISQAQSGYTKQLVDLAQQYRSKDGHIQGCFTGLELAVSKLKWSAQVEPGPSGKAKRKDLKLCAQVEAAIAEIAGWQEAIAHLTGSGEMHGHGSVELTGWRLYDGGNPLLRGWLVPSAAEIVHANRFGYAMADGRLLFDMAGHGDVNVNGADLLNDFPAGKFIQHCPRVTGAVSVSEGLDELIVWHGFFRNFGLKDWVLSAEGGWKPTRIVTYKKGSTDPTDKALALTIARTLVGSGSAAIPDSLVVDSAFPKNGAGGQQSPHRTLCEYLAGELSKATLGHTLLLESGDKGARSLGEVGYDVAIDRRDARALALARTLNAQFIRPLVAMNVARAQQVPVLLPDINGAVDLKSFADSVDVLARRMRVGASYVRSVTRMPEPEKGEEVLLMGAQPAGDAPADDGLDIPVTVEGEEEL